MNKEKLIKEKCKLIDKRIKTNNFYNDLTEKEKEHILENIKNHSKVIWSKKL